ncbi:hypothetical protein VFPPC_15302 [Pochonia chlamydosporia 170]|uniref:Uncharacterized protein n=1 Tax=Pochonia chlamydosporia 170 TaxID=1380566 RepID=A0A179G6I6_METCM|nr:hypothetical protein VFPPC_15302 [Pochonia chlamydosporia 170]OAQ73416.1 hypothetical protein VFPPC_15302 [Pochonia chlamydosporia 170]
MFIAQEAQIGLEFRQTVRSSALPSLPGFFTSQYCCVVKPDLSALKCFIPSTPNMKAIRAPRLPSPCYSVLEP